MNEEDLKNEVVVPFLRQAGFQPGTLQFEKSFSIRLGHGVYKISGDVVSTAKGRLDILCTSNGNPICIVELKSPGVAITSDDLAQGLSYARLTEKITPLVLVTNGTETKLLDTFTGTPVDANAYRGGTIPSTGVEQELKLRYDALCTFVGLSYENLRLFCTTNNASTLEKFRATEGDGISSKLNKKYIPEVYVSREIERAFQPFLIQSKYQVFPIVGDAGVGKTNTICHLVEISCSEPSIFITGTTLGHSLLRDLADRFNVFFSAQESETSLLKKIAAVAAPYGKPFIVFFDAIDEWIAADKTTQLSEAVRAFRALGIKLCVSCNTLAWESMISRNGIQTDLGGSLYPTVSDLPEFSPEESGSAQSLYEKAFNLPKSCGGNLAVATNPFTFRVACEVAYETGKPVIPSGDSRQVIRRYLQLKKQKVENAPALHRTLVAVAKAFATSGMFSLPELQLHELVSLPLGESLPNELFTLGFLLRYVDGLGDTMVTFYFGAIRDYLVALEVLQLGKRNPVETSIAMQNLVGERAIAYFFKTGDAREQEKALRVFADAGDDVLVRMLAWYGRALSPEAIVSWQADVTLRLTRIISDPATSERTANQCLSVLRLFCSGDKLEQVATEWFEKIASIKSGGAELIADGLAEALRSCQNPVLSAKLVALCRDRTKNCYVRRYIIAAIGTHPSVDRAALFSELIVDPSANVRNWVRSWYRDLETKALRNQLLLLLDTNSAEQFQHDIVTTLGSSALPDTGELLFPRLIAPRNTGYSFYWLCRAFGFLGYQRAVPELTSLLMRTDDAELRGHLLIALGDIGDRNGAMSSIKAIIAERPTCVDHYWLTYAFCRLAVDGDYDFLLEVIRTSKNASSRLVAAEIIGSGYPSSTQHVFWDILANSGFTPQETRDVLSQLFSGLVSNDGVNAPHKAPPQRYSSAATDLLRGVVRANSEASTIAFWGLFLFSPDEDRLIEDIDHLLRVLRLEISAREVMVDDVARLERLAPRLSNWTADALDKCVCQIPFVSNLVELARMFGDEKVLEAMARNRPKLLEVVDKERLDAVENTIRTSSRRVRWLH